jgi:hypothetical protein
MTPMTDEIPSYDQTDEIPSYDQTDEIPSYDHKLPMSMSVTEFNHWCDNGKRPTAPMRAEERAKREEELQRMARKFDRSVDSLPGAHKDKDRFWKDWKEMNEDVWYDRRLNLGEGWDLATAGIPLNPRNYQRLLRNEVGRVHREVEEGLDEVCKAILDVEKKCEERMRKEFSEEIKTTDLAARRAVRTEVRLEVRRSMDGNSTNFEEIRRAIRDEVRAEIRRALNADEAVVPLADLRRHGRAA